MKKLALVLMLLLVTGSMAAGSPITGSFVQTREPNYFAFPGGEFTLYNLTGIDNAAYSSQSSNIALAPSFQTFCLETGEHLINQTTYFAVNSAAVLGGTPSSSDPLSKGASWLYRQFVEGNLAGYFTSGDRVASATSLQQAIWMLEDEIPTPTVTTNVFYNLAIAHGGKEDAGYGYLSVFVLNNFRSAAARDEFVRTGKTDESTRLQDFFWAKVPDGGATLTLLGAALLGMGTLRRRFRP